MENYSEKKIIKLSMVVLFLSLMIIYVLFYHMKGKTLSILKEQQTLNTQNLNIEQELQPELIAVTNTGTVNHNTNEDTNTNTGNQFSPEFYDRYENQDSNTGTNEVNDIQIIEVGTGTEDSNEEVNTNGEEIQTNNIVNLSGTTFYHGPIEGIEKLGISYPYALKDNKDIYYIYLGDSDYDFAEIVRKLNGYLYIVNTEQELLKNNLFGEKVTYINVPEYKDKTVLMLIEINNKKWLVQVSYAIYHESKTHLKSVFSQN